MVTKLNSKLIWKILLIISIGITTLSLLTLLGLEEKISGDGIPNRPQGEPPIEYPWGKAMQTLLAAVIFSIMSGYFWSRVSQSGLGND